MKKTLIIGATTNPSKYAYKAFNKLKNGGFAIEMIGLRSGMLGDHEIHTNKPEFDEIHTVTLYVGAKHQAEYYNYLIDLRPERVIFNPGTENEDFKIKLEEVGIEALEACTLVMLSVGNY